MAGMRYSKYGEHELLFDPATGKVLFQQPEQIYSQTNSETFISDQLVMVTNFSKKLFKQPDQLNNPTNGKTPVFRPASSKLFKRSHQV